MRIQVKILDLKVVDEAVARRDASHLEHVSDVNKFVSDLAALVKEFAHTLRNILHIKSLKVRELIVQRDREHSKNKLGVHLRLLMITQGL